MQKNQNLIGSIFKSNNSGKFKIISYVNYENVVIEFIDTGFITTTRLDSVFKGKVEDKLAATVCGIGIIGDKHPSTSKGVATKEYLLWVSMLTRCYSDRYHKLRDSYKDCKASVNFQHYTYFYEWCNQQIGFNDNWELDKDLLIKGNKIYSENSCVFLPSEINIALIKCKKRRGNYPIGVSYHIRRNKFVARVNIGEANTKSLGSFDTAIEAFNAYKTAKEAYLKELAEKWKDAIDPKAYNALINYQVEITD